MRRVDRERRAERESKSRPRPDPQPSASENSMERQLAAMRQLLEQQSQQFEAERKILQATVEEAAAALAASNRG
eukprot:6205784-Pleurochrysis_carterae.AAC.1